MSQRDERPGSVPSMSDSKVASGRPTTNSSAASEALNVAELVEMILSQLSLPDLASARRVCKFFNEVAAHSCTLGKDLLLIPATPPPWRAGYYRRVKNSFISENAYPIDLDIVWRGHYEPLRVWSHARAGTRNSGEDRLPMMVMPSRNELWRRVRLSDLCEVVMHRYCVECGGRGVNMGKDATVGDVYDWLRSVCEHE